MRFPWPLQLLPIALLLASSVMPVWGQALEGTPADSTLVPQTLLPLFHAVEVVKELQISDDAYDSILPQLQEIDGPWWASRNLPADKHRKVIQEQEKKLVQLVESNFSPSSLKRLRQLEIQAQGYRALVRPDVGRYLKLTAPQTETLSKKFETIDTLASKIFSKPGVEDPEAKKAWNEAKSKEPEWASQILTSPQKQRLAELIGPSFDTQRLERIYPLAPEFSQSESWIGKSVRLQDLKGKVVLVHFYAFQCSNCKANFPIYRRWTKELESKGVEVIGIQTPETSAESKMENVQEAYNRDGFAFPVLQDGDRVHWDKWANTMWPTVYVLDKKGFIRFWWQGELRWQGATVDEKIEKLVAKLLTEN